MPRPDKADLIEQMLSEHRLKQHPGEAGARDTAPLLTPRLAQDEAQETGRIAPAGQQSMPTTPPSCKSHGPMRQMYVCPKCLDEDAAERRAINARLALTPPPETPAEYLARQSPAVPRLEAGSPALMPSASLAHLFNAWMRDHIEARGYAKPGVYSHDQLRTLMYLAFQGASEAPRLPPSHAAGKADDYKALYHALLFEVVRKHPGESRHETALRYIQQAEQPQNNGPVSMLAAEAPVLPPSQDDTP